MVLTILQCSDAWAAFLGFTWSTLASEVRWITGDEKAMYAGLGCPEQSITVEQCQHMTLLGSLPQGDQAHAWTGAEFHQVIG